MKVTTFTSVAAFLCATNALVLPRSTCVNENDCEGDLICIEGACAPLGQNGDHCSNNEQCAGDLACNSGVCGTEGNEPQCFTHDDCEGDLYCDNGKCKALLKPGEGPCTTDNQCEGDVACNAGICGTWIPTSGLSPDYISLYHVNNGSIEYHTNRGLIEKTQGTGNDVSTLVTFTFPANTAGKQCQIVLDFSSYRHYIRRDGSQNVDIFTSLYPATHSTSDWPAGNGRNNQLGRVKVHDWSVSTVEWGNMKFPCPSGQTLGYELVPTGDSQHIEWSLGPDGPKVVVTNS